LWYNKLELGAWSLELGAWSLELGAWSLELVGVYSAFCPAVTKIMEILLFY
jgi:hypothetical protein